MDRANKRQAARLTLVFQNVSTFSYNRVLARGTPKLMISLRSEPAL
jgi:hypothetical protein